MTKLGLRLDNAIRNAKILKKGLAQQIGVSDAYVSRLISGKRNMSEKFARKAAPVLGVSVAYLLGKTDDPFPDEPSEIVKWGRQQGVFLPLQQILRSIGIDITIFISIGNEYYEYEFGIWEGDTGSYDDNEMYDYLKIPEKGEVHYGVKLEVIGMNEIYMEYCEFQEWEKLLINSLGDLVRIKFPELKAPIIDDIVKDDIQKVIDN